ETIRLWDATTGKVLRTLTGDRGWLTSLAFSADGKLLASSSEEGKVWLWDPETGKRLREVGQYPGRAYRVNSVAFSQDGKTLVVSCEGLEAARVVLWDVATGRKLRALEDPGEVVCIAQFAPEGTIVAGATDRTVRIWSTATGKQI